MLVKMLGSIFFVLLILGGVAYASGWIQMESDSESTNVKIDTGEIKKATDKALDKGKELINDSAEKVDSWLEKDTNNRESNDSASTESNEKKSNDKAESNEKNELK